MSLMKRLGVVTAAAMAVALSWTASAGGRVVTAQVAGQGGMPAADGRGGDTPARAYNDLLAEGTDYSKATAGGVEAEVLRLRKTVNSLQERLAQMDHKIAERDRTYQAEQASYRRDVENRLNLMGVQVQGAAADLRAELDATHGTAAKDLHERLAASLRQEWDEMRAQFTAELDQRYRQVVAALQAGRDSEARAGLASMRDTASNAAGRIRIGLTESAALPPARVETISAQPAPQQGATYQYAVAAPATRPQPAAISAAPEGRVVARASSDVITAGNGAGVFEVRVRTTSYDKARDIYQKLMLRGMTDLRFSAIGDQFVIHLGRFRYQSYAQRRKEWADRQTGLSAEIVPVSG